MSGHTESEGLFHARYRDLINYAEWVVGLLACRVGLHPLWTDFWHGNGVYNCIRCGRIRVIREEL